MIAVVVVMRSTAVHDGLAPNELGGFVGWVTVAADPDPSFDATRVLLDVEGERFESWVRGRAAGCADTWQQGDLVWVEGVRRPLDPQPPIGSPGSTSSAPSITRCSVIV